MNEHEAQLLNTLRSSEPARREDALEKLSGLSGLLGWVACRALISDPDELVRNRAAELLEDHVGHEDERPLLSLLEHDPSALVRSSAASSLGRLRGDASKPALVARLSGESDETVRRYVAVALAGYGDPGLGPMFRDLLGTERHPYVRTGLLYGLYRSGGPDGLEELLGLLGDEDYMVRCQVLNALLIGVDPGDAPLVRRRVERRKTSERHPAVLEVMGAVLENVGRVKD